MKKINKIATQDAMRLVEADKFVTNVIIRANTDPKYNDALEKAYRNIQANQTSVAIAQKMNTPLATKLKWAGLIAAGVIVLHETGYDEVIWNKLTRWARRTTAKAEQAKEELKETFPGTAEKLADVKDTVVDTAKTAAGEAKAAYGDHENPSTTMPTYGAGPNIQKDTPSSESP